MTPCVTDSWCSAEAPFEASIVATTRVGDYDAVIASTAGQAWITGIYQVGMDPTDPFPRGFTVADTAMRQVDRCPASG